MTLSLNDTQHKGLGICGIDFLIFRCCVRIFRLKFLRFERGWNAPENVWISNRESKKLWNSKKADEI